MREAVAAVVPRARLPVSLRGALIRANPRLALIPFASLSDQDRAGLGSLPNDSALYGVVRDEHGAIKVADLGFVRLIEQLREPQRVEGELAEDERGLVRLVLDGLLEVEAGSDDFRSGSRAYEVVCGIFSPPSPTTKTALSSERALRYAQRLDVEDAPRLSARLYFYGRLPMSPSWVTRYPTRGDVERFLQIEPGATLARRMRRAWQAVDLAPPNDGWFQWAARQPPGAKRSDRYKLYVSPRPESVPAAFSAAVGIAEATGAVALKVGNDAPSFLRPDKIVLYFADIDGVTSAAARLAQELGGCPGHGVPFTAELAGSEGLLSFGIDPPHPQHTLAWQERESWRLWLTNRLATALLAARRDGGMLEPWQYALARLEFEGIDPSTWAPRADLWDQAA